MVVVHMSNSGVGWICMDACMIEATLNASILYWVSSGAPSDSVKHVSMPEIPVTVKINSRVTAAITSTLQFMGQTDSHHTASLADRDPEKGLPPPVVGNSNYQVI
ncbi:hypothetical protein VNI00_013703 [Paramarasmius palmivorus]|uniref:Uncharacterized protein n=1 Tax=Paramarasmius palmivorus TaxID=297713 RepID=A0AAW0BW30_9AGAR